MCSIFANVVIVVRYIGLHARTVWRTRTGTDGILRILSLALIVWRTNEPNRQQHNPLLIFMPNELHETGWGPSRRKKTDLLEISLAIRIMSINITIIIIVIVMSVKLEKVVNLRSVSHLTHRLCWCVLILCGSHAGSCCSFSQTSSRCSLDVIISNDVCLLSNMGTYRTYDDVLCMPMENCSIIYTWNTRSPYTN